MRVAYVIGRYRDARGEWFVEGHRRAAEAVAAELWQMGFAVLLPHRNAGGMDGLVPDQTFLDGDLEMLGLLRPGHDVAVTVSNWRASDGAGPEYATCCERGVATYHWPYDAHVLRDLIERDRRAEQATTPGPYQRGVIPLR